MLAVYSFLHFSEIWIWA